MKKLTVLFFTFFTLFILFPKTILAEEYFFQDEFNAERVANSLDSKWTVYPNTTSNISTIRETGGKLITYQANNTHQFPYIVAKNSLPDGNFSIEIKFQYTYVSNWGTGIAIADKAFENNSGSGPLLLVDTWQDLSNQPNLRLEFNGQRVFGKTFDLNPHILRVDRIEKKYIIYFDSILVFTSPDILEQAKDIFMGNPAYLSGLVPSWTKFNVDYVRVKQLKTPVIFIPGVGGSEFTTKDTVLWSLPDGHGGTYTHTYPAGEKVWVNETKAIISGDDDYFDILKLNADGLTSPVDLSLTDDIYSGAYGDTIKYFTDNGYTLNQDLFVFPYDWRKDIALTAPLLDDRVEYVKSLTGATKVDIVAHSMGGLVARNYITNPARALKVRKLITLGTPHLGAVDFLKNLKYGGCLTKRDLGPICIGISPSEMKDVLQNMIGGLELAPTQKYFEFYSGEDELHPFPFRDDSDIDNDGITGPLNYDKTKTLLTNLGHNTPLFTPTEAFHTLDNNLSNTNGVEVSIIAGSGIDTLGQIIEKNEINFAGIKIPYKDLIKINGDETVPLLSASLTDPHKNLFLNGNAIVYYTKQKHSQLVFNGPAMNMVNTILGSSNILSTGISFEPYKLEGHEFSVHSPVNINAYDQLGNHTGPLPNGDFEVGIPGSSYDTLDDAKFIFLPDDGIYNLKFEATDQGSFDFKIRDYKNDINDQTILYKDVPLTINTKAETTFDTNYPTPPTLQVDQDGNGSTDFQVNETSVLEGDASYDQIPPKTTINFTGTQGNNNWYINDVTVELNATDETNGSGILKTEYSLDNGQTINVYTAPFTVSQEGITQIQVKSTDKAGNEEYPLKTAEIKMDKTSPEAKISFNMQSQSLEITGTDNLTSVSAIESANTETLTDEAGNITKLRLNSGENEDDNKKQDDEKENEKDKDKEKENEHEKEKIKRTTLSLRNISYNNSPTIRFADNEFKIKFDLDRKTNNIKEFKQDINIEKQLELSANYNLKKNLTSIEIQRQKDKKQKEEKNEVVIVNLQTNNGKLEVKY